MRRGLRNGRGRWRAGSRAWPPFRLSARQIASGNWAEGYARRFFSLSPFLGGEGWGEGLHPQLRWEMDSRRVPLTRIASSMRSDLSPHAGRGEAESRTQRVGILDHIGAAAGGGAGGEQHEARGEK